MILKKKKYETVNIYLSISFDLQTEIKIKRKGKRMNLMTKFQRKKRKKDNRGL